MKMKDKNLMNEDDIRPKNLMAGQQKAMREDINWLKNKSKAFILK